MAAPQNRVQIDCARPPPASHFPTVTAPPSPRLLHPQAACADPADQWPLAKREFLPYKENMKHWDIHFTFVQPETPGEAFCITPREDSSLTRALSRLGLEPVAREYKNGSPPHVSIVIQVSADSEAQARLQAADISDKITALAIPNLPLESYSVRPSSTDERPR
jgi:hypothetical protein